ncbi:hypothetical protein [Nesterenkonia sandarakina]|uniref:Uncharacterized protein n=1 Tax=Nesterenkonia sandarakina TaxID=272918 RepID=A0A7Z0J2Z4_9MICC|nr:hypothetical protein [Nesterenkonia sandarakina]NYJ16777.1 hypothetical protein [Nesterenkonia sandarakina]
MTAPLSLSTATATASATAAAPAMPGWAPLVFGIASLLVLVLVIVLARRKMHESARWQQSTRPEPERDDPQQGPPPGSSQDPRIDPPRNDGA